MADDQRIYSDEEFALILKHAAELASKAEQPGASSGGLTLLEMKAAAAQAGFDPAVIEQAAHTLASQVRETPFERFLGGPLRHKQEVRIPIKLDEQKAALLLSAVRISTGIAGSKDVGHSSSLGMTWHDGDELEALGVTARPEKNGTAVSVTLDRRGTLFLTTTFSGIALVLAFLFSAFALAPENPAFGIAGLVISVGGVLAIARTYWAASTKKVRERISSVVDTVSQTLTQPDTEPSKPDPPVG